MPDEEPTSRQPALPGLLLTATRERPALIGSLRRVPPPGPAQGLLEGSAPRFPPSRGGLRAARAAPPRLTAPRLASRPGPPVPAHRDVIYSSGPCRGTRACYRGNQACSFNAWLEKSIRRAVSAGCPAIHGCESTHTPFTQPWAQCEASGWAAGRCLLRHAPSIRRPLAQGTDPTGISLEILFKELCLHHTRS